MEYTPITINNIDFLQWSRGHKNNNKLDHVVNVPSCFTKRKYDHYHFPAPTKPAHISNCPCMDCSLFTLLNFDTTLVDKRDNTGHDKYFKSLIQKKIILKKERK